MLKTNKLTGVALVTLTAALSITSVSAGMVWGSSQSQAKTSSVNLKLAQIANFIPKSKQPLEQLIEVAKYFKIPMGIEWNPKAAICNTCELSLGNSPTVKDLIDAILLESPSHQISVNHEMVHIAPALLASDPKNILNLKIDEFDSERESLFDAEERLRLYIDMKRYPEKYANGYFQSFGYAPDHVFAIKNVSFSGTFLTVREILDGIAEADGNALWIVELDEKDLSFEKAAEAARQAVPRYIAALPWKFVPLSSVQPNK